MDVEIERRRRPIGMHAMDGMHSNQRTKYAHCVFCSVIPRYPLVTKALAPETRLHSIGVFFIPDVQVLAKRALA